MKKAWMAAMALSGLLLMSGCSAQEPKEETSVTTTPKWEEVLEKEEEKPAVTVAKYAYQYANMELALPEGWNWSVTEYTPDCSGFGLSFWPEDASSGKIDLFYYPAGFGVCGTGLSTQEIAFENGLSASIGTYDNGTVWDFISYEDTAGAYAAQTHGVKSWWAAHGGEAMKILSGAKLGQGSLREEEALELALQNGTVEHSRVYTRFDFETGTWTVELRGKKSESLQEIAIDADGVVTQTLCGLPVAPEKGAAVSAD